MTKYKSSEENKISIPLDLLIPESLEINGVDYPCRCKFIRNPNDEFLDFVESNDPQLVKTGMNKLTVIMTEPLTFADLDENNVLTLKPEFAHKLQIVHSREYPEKRAIVASSLEGLTLSGPDFEIDSKKLMENNDE